MSRKAKVERKTRETEIRIEIELDGKGDYRIDTTIPFLDHMLALFAKHGLFDLKIRARGDTEVDYHHTVEDIGITLGNVVKKALGDMRGIRRYGVATVPMDETLTEVSIDISARPYLIYNVALPKRYKLRDFDPALIEDFFRAFANHCGVNLHINLRYGKDIHHIIESIFKAFGRALDEAIGIDPRIKGIQSTKGRI